MKLWFKMPIYTLSTSLKQISILFIHIPKCGGGSIEKFLRDNNLTQFMFSTQVFKFLVCPPKHRNRCSLQHMHASLLEAVLDINSFDYIFTIVRNPVHRIISEYKWRILDDSAQKGFDMWYEKTRKSFNCYNFFRDNHIRPMNEFITRNCEVFRFEDRCFDKLPCLIEQKLESKGKDLTLSTREISNQKKNVKARRLKNIQN